MKEITVKYLISDEQEQRLLKITEEYNKQGVDNDINEQFEFIMTLGSKFNIDEKLKFHEYKLGLKNETN